MSSENQGFGISESLKAEGNDLFKNGHYAAAIEKYTQAIENLPERCEENQENFFAFYSNRANAYFKIESYGFAIEDAKTAIELQGDNPKGYYRLGTSYYMLSKYKDAKKAFQLAYQKKPTKMFKENIDKCKQEIRRIAFEEAISTDQTAMQLETYKIEEVTVTSSYEGPHLCLIDDKQNGHAVDGVPEKMISSTERDLAFDSARKYQVTEDFVKKTISWMLEQKVLHTKFVAIILIQAYEIFSKSPSLLEITLPKGDVVFNVCGDTHGQFYDLKNIFEINGYPSETNQYLFNGDFVDRGSFSVEVIITLLSYKLLYPDSFHMLRGNHETRNMNRIYGFDGEVEHKYDGKILKMFSEVFRQIPLAAVVNKKVLIVHGGLPTVDGVKLDDIKKIERNREPPEEGLMSDLLWSDPQPFPGRGPSKRGVGKSFGPDVTKQFLQNNGLDLLIRSHEVRDEGYLVEHDGMLITVFSAPNYCDSMGNKGALVKLSTKNNLKPEFVQFDAVSHPPVKPMAYAGNMGMFA